MACDFCFPPSFYIKCSKVNNLILIGSTFPTLFLVKQISDNYSSDNHLLITYHVLSTLLGIIRIKGKFKYFSNLNFIRSFSAYLEDYAIQMFSLIFLKTLKNIWPGIQLYLIRLFTLVLLWSRKHLHLLNFHSACYSSQPFHFFIIKSLRC